MSDNEGWYLNTANFLRSIRNFKIDIRLTDPSAYICGIHWQVSQATSLENIEFYMQFNSDIPDNTQQVGKHSSCPAKQAAQTLLADSLTGNLHGKRLWWLHG